MNIHLKHHFVKIDRPEYNCSKDDNSSSHMPTGYVSDANGNPVLTCCRNCDHIETVSDSSENTPASYICHQRPHMSNLQGFPFNTPQRCFELNLENSVDWDMDAERYESVTTGWVEIIK